MGFTTAHGPQWTYQPPAAVGHVVDARAQQWRCTCRKDFDVTPVSELPARVAAHGAKLIGYRYVVPSLSSGTSEGPVSAVDPAGWSPENQGGEAIAA